MNGTIKTVNTERGFGFISTANGREFFFHRSGVLPAAAQFADLREGDAVTFEEEPSDRGPRAKAVRPVEATTPA